MDETFETAGIPSLQLSGSTSLAALHLLGNVEILGRGRAIKGYMSNSQQ